MLFFVEMAARIYLGLILAILLVLGVIVMDGKISPGTVGEALWGGTILAAIIVTAGAIIFTWLPESKASAEFLQGMAAVAALIALCIAGGIYFVERSDRPRLSFGIDADVVPTSAPDRTPENVLLFVRIPVTNTGRQQLTVPCIGLDVEGLRAGSTPGRKRLYPEELAFERIREPIAFKAASAGRCIHGEAERSLLAAEDVRPLFMWDTLELEPNQTSYLYFEMVVPCSYSLIRVLVKFRIDPDEGVSSESKTVVPISAVCSRDADARAGTSGPRVDTGVSEPGEPEISEPPANGGAESNVL